MSLSQVPSATPSIITSIPSAGTTINAEHSEPSQGGWSSRLDFTPPSFHDGAEAVAAVAAAVPIEMPTAAAQNAAAAAQPPSRLPSPPPHNHGPTAYPILSTPQSSPDTPLGPHSLGSLPAPEPVYAIKQPRSADPSPRGPVSLPRNYRKPNRHRWSTTTTHSATVLSATVLLPSGSLPLPPTGGRLPRPSSQQAAEQEQRPGRSAAMAVPTADAGIPAVGGPVSVAAGGLEPGPQRHGGSAAAVALRLQPWGSPDAALPHSLGEQSFMF
eukprot:jgi/Ulvmu1/6648/UM003_0286.1